MDRSQPLSPLAPCFRVVKTFLSRRRPRRILLTIPIIIGIGLLLSLQTLNPADLRDLSEDSSLSSNHSLPISQPYNPYTGPTIAREVDIPDATWTCTDDDLPIHEQESNSNKRSRQCVVRNLCVDSEGAFIRTSNLSGPAIPRVNLLSSHEKSDSFWTPRMENSTDRIMRAHYVDETVFVHGIFWPNHFTHWLYNGMLPLYSTMKRFGGTKNSWLLKLNSEFFNYDIQYQGEWEMRHFFHTGLELVLREEEVATDFQTLPPSDAPICFSRAVIGLGSQCALGYCVKNIPWEIYHSFRDYLADFYWRTPQIWQRHIRTTMDLIAAAQPNKQQEQQEQQKQQSTPLKCLDLARYYNFEPSTGADPLVPLKESKSRVGHHSPDTVDPEVVTTSNGRRKLVVAMIQREGTRRVINDQELVESLASAGFRVKWITFDHGCGLAETAYLLRDVHVLATPHGNAIGTSVFMPTTNPVPTIITLDASRYSENWFINTVTALGQRFIQSVCGPHAYVDAATKARCPYYRDEALAHKALGIWGADIVLGLSDELAQSYKAKAAQQNLTGEAIHEFRDYVNCTPSAQRLAKQELELLLGPEYPAALVAKYDADIMDYFIEVFWRDSPRYADVPRVVALVQELQKDQEKEQAAAALGQQRPELQYQQYLNYLRQSRACGVKYCKRIIKRNVISELRAFGVHSIDDLGRWGQSAVNETIFQGLEDVPNWIPEALVPNNLSI